MSAHLLATKFQVPLLRSEIISRSILIRRISEGLNKKLILVSAPAGFGKTTLLGEWARTCDRTIAWLSLDASDNETNRFGNISSQESMTSMKRLELPC